MSDENQSRVARHGYDSKKTQKKTPKQKPKGGNGGGRAKKILLRTFLGLVVAGFLALIAGGLLFWSYAKDAEKLTDKKLEATQSAVFYANNGTELVDLGSANRVKISAQEIPQQLEDAIISVEDRRFYKHIGIDPVRIVSSALSNILHRGSGGLQGGSTLTQQLIKLSYFSTKTSDQTLKRKAQEAWLSIELEQKKSKQEILTYYINKVYMSNGLYGMETAAQSYFGKTLKDLNLAQTALLAGMPQAPSTYDPYVNPEYAKQRRDIVLSTMLDNDKITQAEYDEAIKVPITDGLKKLENNSNNWALYDPIIKEAIAEVKEKTGKDPYDSGMKIYTNTNPDLQKRLYEIVNSDKYVNFPNEKMQVATTVVDTKTGKVLAQIGGRNIDKNTVLGNNQAVNTDRDFGSTVKPVTDYGPAFENLKVSTGKTIEDAPYKYPGTDISVNNWDRQYMGYITLRKALYESRNVPAVKLFEEVGADKVSKFLNGLGIEYPTLEAANAISSNTSKQDGNKYGVSSEKLAAAYAAFANGGTYYKPQYVNKIEYQDGSSEEFKPEGKRAMSEGTAYMITDILKDVITMGTGTNAQIDGLIQAGKTGTSNYTDDQLETLNATGSIYPDITFTGYTPSLAMSVWTGYENRMTPITDATSMIATDVYREFMSYAAGKFDDVDWELPDDLTRVGNELYFTDNYTPEYIPQSKQPASSVKETETKESSTAQSSTKEANSEPSSSSTPAPSSTQPSSEPPASSTTPPSTEQPPTSSTEPNQGNGGNGQGAEENQNQKET